MLSRSASRKINRSLSRIEPLENRQLMTITASLVQVPIPAGALTDDPSLANYKTYDLKLNVGTGDDWISTDLRVDLTGGTFYKPASDDSNYAQPAIWNIAGFRELQADTFVATPEFDSPIILGAYDPAGRTSVFGTNVINVTYGDFPNTGAGEFTVARLTMTSGASATIRGRIGSRVAPSTPTSFNFNVTATGTLRGSVYRDRNGNGTKDGTEPGLTGWRVYIDKDNDNIFDAKELNTLTTSTGVWSFEVPANVVYRVRAVKQTGFRQTQPVDNQWLVSAPGGGSSVRNFGFTSSIIASGFVYRDNNNNKIKDSNETGLAGWRVFEDVNNNGRWDSSTEASVLADASGKYTFLSLSENTNHTLRVVVSSGWKLTTQSSFVINSGPGTEVTKKNFGIRKL